MAKKYQLTNGNTILADEAFMEAHHAGEYTLVIEPELTPEGYWLLSRLAFKKRFPPAKWKAARAASAFDMDLADFFEDFDLAKYIDLKDPRILAAIPPLAHELVPVDFRLTQEEVDAILLIPCQSGEEP